ncbi:MAG: ATP-binding protein [Bacteroidota bacterium]
MVFSRFIWSILAFVAAIVGTSILLGIYLQKPEFPVTRSILIVALILETIAMLWYLTRIRRDLLKLINAMSNDDPTMQFSRVGHDPYFSAIHKGFNALIRDFRLVRLDREAEQRFFEETVNHVQFGLVAFNGTGEVKMVNQAFLELFRLGEMVRLDDLKTISADIPEFLGNFSPGKETLKKMELSGQSHHLIFLSSGFVLKNEEITLVSVRDISREMDQNELEAWQKLLRVLRHEILNSISPIKLIAGNLSERLQPEGELLDLDQLKENEIGEIKTGLETIHRRATGLSEFLDAYANLYRVPDLQVQPELVCDLLDRVSLLFTDQFGREKIRCNINCRDMELTIAMDERMIEQVLINLVKNSLDAMKESQDQSIQLYAEVRGRLPVIGVKDSGKGIPPDQLESIFIPFYSTKEGGTGIGLSFSQHVMRLHHGQLKVNTSPGQGTDFQLVFPQ